MMKKLHLLFTMLLLSLLGTGNAWADTVTFTAGTDTSDGTSITKDGITISFSSGVFNRTDNYRCYSGASMTISAESGITMTQIDFTATSSNPMTKFSGDPNVGSWTDETKTQWTGSASEINFGTTSGQARITEIVITYTTSGTVIPTVSAPTFSPAAGTYAEAQEVTISSATSGATIYYTLDGNDPTTSSDVYSSAIEIDETTTIKAIAVKDGMNDSDVAEATYTIDPNASGTESNPYTVAEANAAIAAGTGITDVYVKGIVSKVVEVNTQYGNATYWISDDGTESGQLEVYRGKYINKAAFTSADEIQVGDIVVVFGTLQNYNGTYEFTNTNYLVSLDRPVHAVEAPVFTPAGGTYSEAQSVEITCATENATIYYTIDGTDPTNESTEYTGAIAVSATTTIKAIAYVGTDASQIVSAKYTIEVPGEVVIVEDDKTTFLFNTSANEWEFPTTKEVEEGEFTANGYTIKVAGTDGNGYRFYTGDKYLLMGKQGAYLTLPAFDFPVSKIEVVGREGASGSVVQNIFVGDQAVSTETTGATGTNTYEIADGYQDAGNIYTLKVTSAHNTQITQIIVYKGEVVERPQYFVAGTWTNWETNMLEMTRQSDGTYVLADQELEVGAQFQIVKKEVGSEDLIWYGKTADGTYWLTKDNADGVDFELEQGKQNLELRSASTFTFTVTPSDTSAPTVNVSGWPETSYYLSGDFNAWAHTLAPMTKNEDGTYTITQAIAVDQEFKIIDSDENWYGAVSDGDFWITDEISTTPISMSTTGNNLIMKAENDNAWTLTFNPADKTLTITGWPKPELEGNAFVKVTDNADLTDGYYLIVNEEASVALDGSLETLDAVGNTIEVILNNGEIEATAENKAAVFYIDTTEGSLQSASGYYIGVNSSSSNGLNQTDNESTYTNTFSINDNGDAIISAGVFNEIEMTLRFNSASNQLRFRYFKNSGQKPIALYKLTEVEAPTVVVGQRGAVSFSCTKALDFTNSEVEAYIVTEKNGSSFTKKQVTRVPANTGLVIEGAEGEYELTVAAADAEFDNVEDNLLVATSTGEYTVTDETYERVYGLFYSTTQNKMGFQKKKVGYTFGVDKCYLLLPEGSSAKGLEVFFFDETTGIDTTFNAQRSKNEVYNLNGQRVDNNYKGVVIVNGKKAIKK
jgi:hypothetical protein